MIVLLRTILCLSGLGIVALGLNVGLGGFATLGWQGPTNFFTVTDPNAFAVQDNHIRFIAGVWGGVGVLFILGAVFLDRMRPVLIGCIFLIFMGGLARISSTDWPVLTGADIAPSLLMELIVFPAIGLWIMRSTGQSND
ncbi:MAG: DUF4345 domain-containing protein [Erythrobacter sp.]